MRYRATGLRPDTPLASDPRVTDLPLGVGAVPDEWSNEHLLYRGPPGDERWPAELLQFGTQTCVAQQASEAIWCEQRSAGMDESDCVLISPRAAYFAGLRRENGKDALLVDIGSRPRDVWGAMREIGTCRWEDCPLTEDRQGDLLVEPPKGVWLACSDPGYVTDYRYDYVALSERPDVVKRVLYQGHGIGIGLTLSQDFEDAYDVPWQGRNGQPIVGRHMVHAYGYDGAGVWIQNWWRGWGHHAGRGQIAWEVITSPETTDFVTAVLDLTKW